MSDTEGYSDPVWLDLDQIDPRPASEIRAACDTEAIENYAEDIAKIQKKHPALVMEDNGSHWLVDGRHRYEALKRKGQTRMWCRVKRGTYIEAFKEASHSNTEHGVRITNADKRHRVEVALKHPEMKGWSNRQVAEWCGVDRSVVDRLKPQVAVSATSKVQGKDGKLYPARKAPKPRPAPTPPAAPLKPPEPTPVEPEPEIVESKPEPSPQPESKPAPSHPLLMFRPVESQILDAFDGFPEPSRVIFVMSLYGVYVRLCDQLGIESRGPSHGA